MTRVSPAGVAAPESFDGDNIILVHALSASQDCRTGLTVLAGAAYTPHAALAAVAGELPPHQQKGIP